MTYQTRPNNAAQAIEWANTPRTGWASLSSGDCELAITLDDARRGHPAGPCDADVAELRRVPYIWEQLDRMDPEQLREGLRGWGAWSAEELADHDENLTRWLWLACGDIVEAAAQGDQ